MEGVVARPGVMGLEGKWSHRAQGSELALRLGFVWGFSYSAPPLSIKRKQK